MTASASLYSGQFTLQFSFDQFISNLKLSDYKLKILNIFTVQNKVYSLLYLYFDNCDSAQEASE